MPEPALAQPIQYLIQTIRGTLNNPEARDTLKLPPEVMDRALNLTLGQLMDAKHTAAKTIIRADKTGALAQLSNGLWKVKDILEDVEPTTVTEHVGRLFGEVCGCKLYEVVHDPASGRDKALLRPVDEGLLSNLEMAAWTLLPQTMIPLSGDVPDLGNANSIPEFKEWCAGLLEELRQLRLELGQPEPAQVAPHTFRIIPEIVCQCRRYLILFGVKDIPERFAFSDLQLDQTLTGPEHFPSPIERFLIWASAYRTPGNGLMRLINEVEEFLVWAIAWCKGQIPETSSGIDWFTVKEASQTSGVNSGLISRAVDSGELKSNGKSGRERRIDPADLARWMKERADRPEPKESGEHVESLMKKASDTPRRR
jgi:excisionase family DNA binding protein